jgi:hypothetical protein
MKYFDYDWDCSSQGIILDNEFNSDKLGWKHGDYFKFVNVNGRQMIVKVSDLEKFILQGAENNGQME